MYQFAYLVGDGILAIVWLIFFFLRKDLRKQQVFVSFILAPFGILTQYLWFYHDYWRPEYVISFKIGQIPLGLEDSLFVFLICGIAAVIYESVFKKRHVLGKPRNGGAIFIVLTVIILMAVFTTLGLSSIWASTLALTIGAAIMIIIDKDLIKDAIWTSFLIFILVIGFYLVWLNIYPQAVQKFWVGSALSGIEILKIPIEEILSFASMGMASGILYEFWLNVKKYPKKLRA